MRLRAHSSFALFTVYSPPDTAAMTIRRTNQVYIADTARVLGEVALGPNVNIWYGVSIRGDISPITIGRGTNVQDNAVIHCDHDDPNVIGEHVTIGHGAVVHGLEVGDETLIGMHAVVLGKTRIGRHCLIAAGTIVPPRMEVPDGSVVMGVPGKIVRATTDQDQQSFHRSAVQYIALASRHANEPQDRLVKSWGVK